LTNQNIRVSIQGPQGTYKFDWRLGDDYKTQEPL